MVYVRHCMFTIYKLTDIRFYTSSSHKMKFLFLICVLVAIAAAAPMHTTSSRRSRSFCFKFGCRSPKKFVNCRCVQPRPLPELMPVPSPEPLDLGVPSTPEPEPEVDCSLCRRGFRGRIVGGPQCRCCLFPMSVGCSDGLGGSSASVPVNTTAPCSGTRCRYRGRFPRRLE